MLILVVIKIGLKPSNLNSSSCSEKYSLLDSRWPFEVQSIFVESTLLFAALTSSKTLTEYSSVVSLSICIHATYSFIFDFHIYKQSKQVVKVERSPVCFLLWTISKNSHYSKYSWYLLYLYDISYLYAFFLWTQCA